MSNCDHANVQRVCEDFPQVCGSIEVLRCDRCNALLRPMVNEYADETFLVELPLADWQFRRLVRLLAEGSDAEDA
ncbi:MAG: hypothetical protein ACOC42_02140 [Halobacteriota archaeon]